MLFLPACDVGCTPEACKQINQGWRVLCAPLGPPLADKRTLKACEDYSPLPAHVAETPAASAVIDVLELKVNTVGCVNQNLDSLALPYPRLCVRAVLGEALDDLVRSKPLHAESDVRPECCRPASLDQCDELRARTHPENRPGFRLLICLPLQVGQL